MLRFFDPSAGRIALDGHDHPRAQVGELSPNDIRRAAGESPLHGDACATTSCTAASMRARRKSCMPPRAPDSRTSCARCPPASIPSLGEKGAKLSTGQAQRIGLARAFLRDAPILILDEPTSALDSVNENLVMRGIREWIDERPRERIVLLATHRRSTAALADRIYQIAEGHVYRSQMIRRIRRSSHRGGPPWLTPPPPSSRAGLAGRCQSQRHRIRPPTRARAISTRLSTSSLSFSRGAAAAGQGLAVFRGTSATGAPQIGDRGFLDAAAPHHAVADENHHRQCDRCSPVDRHSWRAFSSAGRHRPDRAADVGMSRF